VCRLTATVTWAGLYSGLLRVCQTRRKQASSSVGEDSCPILRYQGFNNWPSSVVDLGGNATLGQSTLFATANTVSAASGYARDYETHLHSWRYEPATVVSLCSNYTCDLFLSGTLPIVNMGIQQGKGKIDTCGSCHCSASGPISWRVFESCPAQNEEFCASKANRRNSQLHLATCDCGGLRNVDVTRVSLACAIHERAMACEDIEQ